MFFKKRVSLILLGLGFSYSAFGAPVPVSGELKTYYTSFIPRNTDLSMAICCNNKQTFAMGNAESDSLIIPTVHLAPGTTVYYRDSQGELYKNTCDSNSYGRCDFTSMAKAIAEMHSMSFKLSCNEKDPGNKVYVSHGYIQLGIEKGTVSVDGTNGSVSCGTAPDRITERSSSRGNKRKKIEQDIANDSSY